MQLENAVEIYNSEHLNIKFDKNQELFIQEWNHNKELSTEEFRTELLVFKDLFSLHRPKYVLWLQEDFTTKLSLEDHLWIEEKVNVVCLSHGLEKCAFVIGKDLLAQMQVFKFFEEEQSCIEPRHFSGMEEALGWMIKNDEPVIENAKDFEIKFNGKTAEGKSQYTIETSSSNTEAVLKSFNNILSENTFLKNNSERYFSLTNREKQVFQLYANEVGIKKISEELFLSELTVRTHWRNVKKKLSIKSHADIANYKNAFNL